MTNPNPTRITDEMWEVWLSCKSFMKGVRLGGIYAFKRYYHSSVDENFANWYPNYSIRFSPDTKHRGKPKGKKARAIDLTLSDALMKVYTARLIKAADANDPRMIPVREFYGTVNGTYVTGRIRDSIEDEYKSANSDDSHLWHIHLAVWAEFVDDIKALMGIVSILKGESLEEWERNAGMLPAKEGDSGIHVEFWQRVLERLGFDIGTKKVDGRDVPNFDGVAGPKFVSAVNESRDYFSPTVGHTNKVTAWNAMRLLEELGARGADRETADVVAEAAIEWLEEHKEELRGPAGKTPTKVVIELSGEVTEVE